MIHLITRIVQITAVLGCVSSSFYYLFCLWSAIDFRRSSNASARDASPQTSSPVSILKPLKGVDPDIYQSFRSHCLQNYSEYEIIFGVSNIDDPAVPVVEQLRREFPDRSIQLVICHEILGPNVKVSNLEQMVRVARHELLIVNDSDIRVESDYLRRITAPFGNENVGMVTCLYRGISAATLGSRLESLGISTDFCAGVLVARILEHGLHFGLGSTLAFRRADLERIGGFKAIVDFLADDYELGRQIATLGKRVVLSDVVVETHLPPYDFRGFLSHQIRWARGVRDARLGGYIGLVSTFGLAWALLNLAVARAAAWAWGVLGLVYLLRLGVALVVGKVILRDRQLLRSLWLLPLRYLIATLVWIVSFFGHTVTWRGDRFQLRKGRLTPIR